MVVRDRVYGKVDITDPLLLELINSKALKRLKDISQMGLPDKFCPVKGFSRFEHSLGVSFLLQRLGADREEQVAGLLHDASTTPFSHVADFAFGRGREGIETFHETIHHKLIAQTDIPTILKKYQVPIKRILNEELFPLLNSDIPNLSADRIDYALREFAVWFNPKIIKPCLDHLTVVSDQIVFTDAKTANLFSTSFLSLQVKNWASLEVVIRYDLFSKAIVAETNDGSLRQSDFFGTEQPILKKLSSSKNEKVREIMKSLVTKDLAKSLPKKGQKIYKKFRYVDPMVLVDSQLKRLTSIDRKFKSLLQKERRRNKRGVRI